MSVRDILTKGNVPKKRVTLTKAMGLEQEVEVELWGLTLGERSDVQEQGYDGDMKARMKILYPLVLGPGVREIGSGNKVFGDTLGEWRQYVNAITNSPAADFCFTEIMALSGIDKDAEQAAKNGSQGDENLNTPSPIVSDGEA